MASIHVQTSLGSMETNLSMQVTKMPSKVKITFYDFFGFLCFLSSNLSHCQVSIP
jgi:hypothetical protein